MAFLTVNFFSKCLMRTVTVQAILPVDKMDENGAPLWKSTPFQTLYLLHGMFGDQMDWMTGTRVQRWAQDRNLAVIMPAGENRFYVDTAATGEKYGEFIGKELVEMTRAMFPLSHRREDTFIAGLSMGGYGAIRNGLKYSETFGRIAGLSSGLILNRAIHSDDSAPEFTHRRKYYTAMFGDLDHLLGSDLDYQALVKKLLKEGKELPQMYLCCGTEDFLLEENRDFRDFLEKEGVSFTYEEGPGSHDWDFWDTYLVHVLDWLPLDEKSSGVSSGNVKAEK